MVLKNLTERHVQAIWYDATFRPRSLTTRTGCAVEVLSPGEWNLEAGPDFRNAVLLVGPRRRRIVGDVEIHLCPRDWDLHGHGTDPDYHNIIAHVTWVDGEPPTSLPRNALSIGLGRFMDEHSFSPDQIDVTAYPFARATSGVRACEKSIGHDPDKAKRILLAAGRHRLQMKARRMVGRLCERPGRRRQIFYEELMTSFGYKKNATQFRHVAERIPFDALPREASSARNALFVAGMFEEWGRGATRPNNRPEQRLSQAAELFTSSDALSLMEANDFSRASCRAMVRKLCAEHGLGAGRAAAMVANVIAPFAWAEGRLNEPLEWLPPEDLSGPVRQTAYRMFGRDHDPAAFYAHNGLCIQGLIQIYRDACRHGLSGCTTCRAAIP